MRAGDLRQRIRLERPVVAIDGPGASTTTWVPVATIWAHEVPLTSRQRAESPQVMPARTSSFRIRKREVDPSWRIVYDGSAWDITGIAPNRERDGLDLFASAVDPGGFSG